MSGMILALKRISRLDMLRDESPVTITMLDLLVRSININPLFLVPCITNASFNKSSSSSFHRVL